MKKFYLLFIISVFCLTSQLNAQCPGSGSMVVTPLNLNGSCFANVQNAIPNSNVSIYNASGALLGQSNANASGQTVIMFTCANGPITSALSILVPPGQVCNNAIILQPITLPIKIVSFTGVLTASKKVLVKWETAYELDNEKIELQRSVNGGDYQTINTFMGSGNSVSKKSYSYEDISFVAGTSAYYRLKQTDFNGKTSYSSIVYVNDKAVNEGAVTAFPNPATANDVIQLKGIKSSDISKGNIRITNAVGKNINFSIAGANAIELDKTATAGIYFIRISNYETIKLVRY